MKTTTLAQRANALPETSLTAAFTTQPRAQRPALVKMLPSPTPPDEKLIQSLNELAEQAPFCRPYKGKAHDTL